MLLSSALATILLEAQTVKVLFDASQAEMAANADWVIDADLYNLGTNSSGLMVTGSGSEANPARFPTPAQGGITSTTAQTFWKGALSYWAIDLVRQGYLVETLPFNGLITYGVSTNSQDLTNYKVFIVCEPNIRFSTSERTAIRTFVQNGGGLFMIANHNGSDRNNDGWDPESIWNDLMSGNPYGITFDATSFSQSSTNIRNAPNDPILNGPMGSVTGMVYNSGTSMTLNPAANSNVLGLVFRTGASNTGNTQVLMAASRQGLGKVCAIGDSSPPDDGSGDTNDALYSSYSTDLGGSHRKLLVNATRWLATPGTTQVTTGSTHAPVTPAATLGMDLYPNPASDHVNVRFANSADEAVRVELLDATGQQLQGRMIPAAAGINVVPVDLAGLCPGIYVVRVSNGSETYAERFLHR